MILLVGTISAIDFDNWVTYSDENREVNIKNLFGFGVDYADIKITSHYDLKESKHVGTGYQRVIVQEVTGNEDYDNFIGTPRFLNKKTGEYEELNYYWEKAIYGEIEIEDFGVECNTIKSINGSLDYERCENVFVGTYKEIKIVGWERFDVQDIKKGETITIALVVFVRDGDWYDGIPKFFGKEIKSWAEWDAGLEVDLVAFWTLNEVSGTLAEDFFGTYNLTVKATNGWGAGLLRNAYILGGDENVTTGLDLGDFTAITISLWINRTGEIADNHWAIGNSQGPGNGIFNIRLDASENIEMRIQDDGAGRTVGGTTKSALDQYTHVVMTLNSTELVLYINNTEDAASVMSNFDFDGVADLITLFGNPVINNYELENCDIDEIGIWDRVLTTAEITQLYNDGAGISPFIITPSISINVTSPLSTTFNTNTHDLKYTFTNETNAESCWKSEDGGDTNSSRVDCGTNWTSLTAPEGTSNWFVCGNVTDGTVDCNNVTFIVDTINPNLTIDYPPNNSMFTTVTIDINSTIMDGNLQDCWYSNNSGQTNNTFTCVDNITATDWEQGINVIYISANDSAGNKNSSSVTFTIDSLPPAITIDYPINNSNFSTLNVNVNSTIIDLNIDTCWYSNNSGQTNNTFICVNNLTGINWEEGINIVYISANDTLGQTNSSELITFNIDLTSPTLEIHRPIGIIGSQIVPYNITFNFTAADSTLNTCFYNSTFNSTITIVSCSSNVEVSTQVQISDFIFYHNITLFANDTVGNVNSTITSFSPLFFELQQGFNTPVSEGNIENFSINISLASGKSISTAILSYDLALTTGVFSNIGGTNYSISATRSIPNVVSNQNFTFFWNITTTDNNNSASNSSDQSVLPVPLNDCTTGDILVLNYSLRDEETQNILINATQNTTVEVDVTLFILGTTIEITNFSKLYENFSNVRVCIPSSLLNGSSFRLDALAKYGASDYATEYHNIQNFILTNNTVPQQIKLFDLLSEDSTDFTITFKDSNFVLVENALIDITRNYVAEGIFKTVEIPKTGSGGQTIGHFVRNDIIYTIIVSKNGVILGTFNNQIAVCADILTGDCQLNLNAFSSGIQSPDWITKDNISLAYDFDESARTITTTFTTTGGGVVTMQTNGTQFSRLGNNSVCSPSVTSSSGSVICNIPPTFGNSSVILSVYKDGSLIQTSIFSFQQSAADTFGWMGLFFVLLLVVTIPMLFMESKIMMMVGSITGLIAGTLLNVFVGGSLLGIGSTILWLIVAIGIIIWRVSQEL